MQRGIDFIGVGVGAVIVDDAGRLFLARRGPLAKNERELWEFPGGAVEFGERLADALRREIREGNRSDGCPRRCRGEQRLAGQE